MRNTQHRWIQDEENLEKDRGSMVTFDICDICTELISLPNKLWKNENKCGHPICVNCMMKYITAKVDSRMSRIKCPYLNCGHHLDPLSCRPLIPKLVFDRWCDLLCESAVLKIDRCYCPYRECSVLIMNECGGSTVTKSKCPKCNKLFCFSCRVAWHEGYSCKEGKKLSDWHDVASGVLAENNKWKRCPACHHCVELISGCKVVKCRCGTSFCYKCGRQMKGFCCGGMSDTCIAFFYILLVLLLVLVVVFVSMIFVKYF